MKINKNVPILIPIVAISPLGMAREIKPGIKATLSLPKGDFGNLMNSRIGYGFGTNILIPITGGHAFAPYLDYTIYQAKYSNEGTFYNYKSWVATIGVDYQYYFYDKANKGPFLFMGGGYAHRNISGKSGHQYWYINYMDIDNNAFFTQTGLGLAFSSWWGVDLKYQSLRFTQPNTNYEQSSPSIQLGATFRF